MRFFIQNRVDKNPPERADARACRRLIEFATLPNGKLRFSLKQCPSEQQLVGLFGRLEDKRLAGKPLSELLRIKMFYTVLSEKRIMHTIGKISFQLSSSMEHCSYLLTPARMKSPMRPMTRAVDSF